MAQIFDFAPVQIEDARARITAEGYLVADALVGRAGNIQQYRAADLGDAFADRDPNSVVRVYRPEAEVFAVDSLRTASRLPITLDHPVKDGRPVMVDASNWREFVKGESGEQILRDGEFIRVPIRITDSAAVASVQRERKEFSLGYSAEIVVGDGVTPRGEAYDASLSNIRYNHLAACRAARGGPELRITDERPADFNRQPGDNTMPKIVLIDGLPVDASNPDIAEQAITRLRDARDTAVQALDAAGVELADAKKTIAEQAAEVANLRDAVAAAKPTPAALRDAAGQYARTAAKAQALGVTVTDEMDVAEMQRAAVVAKLGDAAAQYDAAQFAAAFDALTASIADAAPTDPLRAMVRDGAPANLGDARKTYDEAREKRLARMATAYKGNASA